METVSRIIELTTDDFEKAFTRLREKRSTGESGWDMAEVWHMQDPPNTYHKWCVFRIIKEA